jgi:hypothetical protein
VVSLLSPLASFLSVVQTLSEREREREREKSKIQKVNGYLTPVACHVHKEMPNQFFLKLKLFLICI